MKNKLSLLFILVSLASCGTGAETNSSNIESSKIEASSVQQSSGTQEVSNSQTGDIQYPSSWNITCPTGAPSLAFYKHAKDSHFTTNSTPSNIVAMMNSNSDQDIIVIDTVSGIKAIQKGAPYKIAANITFGNFYIAATGNDSDGVMNAGDKIVLFGENQTPDLMFHYIYGNQFDSSIEYVTSVSDAAKCLATGKNLVTTSTIDYVMIAQPALYATLNNASAATYGKSSVYKNVQDLYKEKSGGKEMVQASVFVKSQNDRLQADLFMEQLNLDITEGLKNPELIKTGMDKLSDDEQASVFGIKSNVAKEVVGNGNTVGLGYKRAIKNKASIDSYLELFGVSATNEEIYFF